MTSKTAFSLFRCPIKIKFIAPISPQGLETSSSLTDFSLLRDYEGNIIISGDQLEGYFNIILKQMAAKINGQVKAKELPCENDINNWFHRPRVDDKWSDSLFSARSRFKINDCKLKSKKIDGTKSINRIKLDDVCRSVEEGSLQLIETIAPYGDKVEFSGEIRFFGTKDEADRLHKGLEIAAKFIRALGGMKSIGHGRVEKFKIGDWEKSKGTSLAPSKTSKNNELSVTLNIIPKEPFLVEPKIHNNNVYISSAIFSGGLIKGTIARQLKMAGCLDKYSDCLSAMRITHAKPQDATASKNPAIPKSLAIAKCEGKEPKLIDMAHIDADTKNCEIISEPFYKDGDVKLINEHFPSVDPPTYQRTRTAISKENWTANASQLFSQQLIAPSDDIVWQTKISLPKDKNNLKDKFNELIDYLLDIGLLTLGKTQSEANVERVANPNSDNNKMEIGERNSIRIVLQSDAWLIPFEKLAENNSLSAQKLYKEYFRHAFASNNIVLKDFYAEEYLLGGNRAVRYAQDENRENYYPYLMTSAGSVFIISWTENNYENNNIEEKLQEFVERGLPIAQKGKDWKNCPFIPENGYGEIITGFADIESITPLKTGESK